MKRLYVVVFCLFVSYAWSLNVQAQCNAESGDLNVSRLTYCTQENSDGISVSASGFNDGADYTQAYVLTSGNDLTIVAISTDGHFSTPAPGAYCVHALNYLTEDAPNIPSVGSSAAGVSGGCFDLQGANECTAINVLNPVTIEGDPFCDPAVGGSYFVAVTVRGGFPEFADFGQYLINFPPGIVEWDSDTQSGNLTIGPIPAGATFSLTVQDDGALCSGGPVVITFEDECPDPPTGPDCNPQAGNMAATIQAVCDGEVASVSATELAIDPDNNEVAVYVLHNGTADVVGDIVAASADGVFDGAGLVTNITYYAIAVVGPDNGSSVPDLEDECTAISDGSTAVVFLDPLVVGHEPVCNDADDEFTIVLTIRGGYPAFAGGSYSITGSEAGEVPGTTILGPFSAGQNYSVAVSDVAGCEASIEGDVITCKPTPIELVSFEGEVLSTGNQLKWVTATEYENDFFTLYYSTNGNDFEEVARVEGAGTSTTANSYAFVHKEAINGTNYYRVDQTDFDGTTTSSPVISLIRGEQNFGFVSIQPKPVINDVQLSFNNPVEGEVTITLYDAAGKLLQTSSFNASAGLGAHTINMSAYASGIYFVNIQNGQAVATEKIIK